jgi:oligoribonuclease NrnB/cAMP/cGMP phosphodiesterase (DHH superfamily)
MPIKKLIKNAIDIVIFHANCPDGIGSALAVYTYYKNSNISQPEFFPATHNSPPPNLTNKNVIICDFSYKKNIVEKIIAECKSFLIIDHHISAKNELESLDLNYKIFDINHSGAYLTWMYFFPHNTDALVPSLIKYIEDNDIWKKALPDTLAITTYIASLPFELSEYEKLLEPNAINDIAKPIGNILLKQKNKQIENAISYSSIKPIEIKGKMYFVAFCNSTVFASEIGNQLLEKYPYCDFSLIYTIDGSKCMISLRSANNKVNVSEIALIYGGGGHRNASGCGLPSLDLFGKQIGNNGSLYKNILNAEFVLNKTININENEKITINYVVQNETNYGTKIGGYLLQTKYTEKINDIDTNIQEACDIYRQKTNKNNYYNFSLSIIWYYGNGKMHFIATWNNGLITKENVKNLYSGCKEFELLNDNQAKFIVNGFGNFFII